MGCKTTTIYYCDRCNKEIPFTDIKPTFYYNIEFGNSDWSFYEGRKKKHELCYDCGKELAKFLDGAQIIK